jgi:hypothetical protein
MKRAGLPIFIATLLVLIIGCKSKKKENPESKRTSIVSFIKSQIAHVDTSMYSIIKITYVDTTRSDTAYYPREQFRELAADFLSIPDVATSKYDDRFVEKSDYDESMGRLIIDCAPLNPEKEEIQKQQILIKPDERGGGEITSIIIDHYINTKDSSVQKRMLWQTNKSFQVATTRQMPGQPEASSVYKVIWNEDDDE